jgi:hypothetical protein
MTRQRALSSVVIAALGVLLIAPPALADTCCANTAVGITPRSAMPGDTVKLTGIACLAPDNSGPLPLVLVGYWLSTDRVPGDANPGDTPGNPDVHLAADLPLDGDWLPFASVHGASKAAIGSATIVVPAMAKGSYQLWWRCDTGDGPESGIHYSGGVRLIVGRGAPDTATAGPAPVRQRTDLAPLLVAALAAGVLAVRRLAGHGRRAPGR